MFILDGLVRVIPLPCVELAATVTVWTCLFDCNAGHSADEMSKSEITCGTPLQ